MSVRTLTEIVFDMSQVADGSPADPEVAHSRADDLLCEALATLSVGLNRDTQASVAKLTHHFRECWKWYA